VSIAVYRNRASLPSAIKIL
jgi:hypothetical protein